MTVEADPLPDDPGTLKAMLIAERTQNERLRQIIKELQRHRFGRRAETLPEDQMLLGLEDVEQFTASSEAKTEAANPAERARRSASRRINRGSLPAHLPRIEVVVDIEDHACPCCGNALHRIGEDTGERLDMVPAQFRVLVVRRPKYACRSCENVVVQAPAHAGPLCSLLPSLGPGAIGPENAGVDSWRGGPGLLESIGWPCSRCIVSSLGAGLPISAPTVCALIAA
jgi:transposase